MKQNTLFNLFLIIFVPTAISFVFLITLTHAEHFRAHYEKQAETYLIKTLPNGRQVISFDYGKHWSLFENGKVIGKHDGIIDELDKPLGSDGYKNFRKILIDSRCMWTIDGGKHWACFDLDSGELIGEYKRRH